MWSCGSIDRWMYGLIYGSFHELINGCMTSLLSLLRWEGIPIGTVGCYVFTFIYQPSLLLCLQLSLLSSLTSPVNMPSSLSFHPFLSFHSCVPPFSLASDLGRYGQLEDPGNVRLDVVPVVFESCVADERQ